MSESITRVIDGGRTIETMNGTYEIKGPVKQIDRGIGLQFALFDNQ